MKRNNFNSKKRPTNKPAHDRGRQQPHKRDQSANGNSNSSRSENQIPRDWRVVIGNHAIIEALKVSHKKAKGMWLKSDWESSPDLRQIAELAQVKKVKIESKQATVIDKFGSSHQGAALFIDGSREFKLSSLKQKEKSIVLILDGIEDPHNLGAILRTSWLTGVDGVLIPEDRAVGLTPIVHKVACGGVEHVPVEATTNFSNQVEELKKMGYWVYGLSPRGKKSIFELNLPDKVVWATGAEDKGMRVTTERLCDELAFIPQTNSTASYNASVATAMALTETIRQHAPRSNLKKNSSDE